ncbi:MAG: chalcone isomerase family protein [Gammaproteobacteria bacterium]|nr:chalcone isomerase family protein [Gammaproteobacteria bacterium]MBU0830610.1 chalcone isomerase family protein [Gammaproteobacteria bacterium]MBU0892020.1 chalcone isomerase family protein [Gammaproteobacteria bacterium]MBU1352970.1 chalcone isomerase family protein [Gammaproteobacteria bacterium]MBU1506004.1 chalcone isomerase family protein [Gammaproteobacteria bacterium]
MKNIAITALLISATAVFHSNFAVAQAVQPNPPALAAGGPATTPLAGARMAGQGTLRFLGFDIYRARLWVQPGFDAENYSAHPLALELTYQRNFTAEAIAKRSIEEMRRVGSFSAQQATRWQQLLQQVLPDVKPGDRLLGVYQPGAGAVFQMGGRVVGEVPDAEFARLFFGIWLSPQTSEPGLRAELIAALGTAGQP